MKKDMIWSKLLVELQILVLSIKVEQMMKLVDRSKICLPIQNKFKNMFSMVLSDYLRLTI